ncbi:MAG: hypothetical protein ACRD3W_13545 [Terriglobales bacterium]
MSEDQLVTYAKAEAYLNRTLAYQAAIAVHHLKEEYNIEVQQLALNVAPVDVRHPGMLHVTCTLQSVRNEPALEIQVGIDPNAAIGHSRSSEP